MSRYIYYILLIHSFMDGRKSCLYLLAIVNSVSTSLIVQSVKILPEIQEIWVQSLGQQDPLEKEMTTHSSILFFFFTPVFLPGESHGQKSLAGVTRIGYYSVTKPSPPLFEHLFLILWGIYLREELSGHIIIP